MQSFYKTFALAVMMLVATIGTAFAGPQDFNLLNNTGKPIFYLNVSPADAKEWMPDILGSKILEQGQVAHVTFAPVAGKLWDLMAEFEDGSTIEWYDINLFEYGLITLNADGTALLE